MGAIDNWYLALELPFDPVPEADQAVIAARITQMVAYWSQHAADSAKGAQYTQWREKAEVMRRDLADPAVRARMADEARELEFGPLDKTLRLVSLNGKRPITTEEVRRIATMRGVPVDIAVRRAQAINIEVSEAAAEDPAEYQAVVDEAYAKKPNRYAQFEGFKVDIKVTGATDLYGFLKSAAPTLTHELAPTLAKEDVARLVSSIDAAPDLTVLPTATLREAGKALRWTFFRKTNTAEKTRGSVGRYCESVFGDESSRRDYDVYLGFVARRDTIDTIVEQIDQVYHRRCTRDVAEEFVGQLDRHVGDRAKAAGLFVALCKVKGFDYDLAEAGEGSAKKIEACRCGAVNDVSTGEAICTRCGLPLRRKCPSCHRESSNVHNYCPCGFDFLNVVRAETAATRARSALDTFDLDAAKAHLAEARALYADHADIPRVAAAIQSMEREVGNQLAEIGRHVTERRLHTARHLLSTLRATRPGFDNPALAAHLDDELRRASTKLAEARVRSSPAEVLHSCREVFGICRDLPGLQELAAQYTDLPLEALSVNDTSAGNVSVAQVNHKVVVRMDAPDEGEKAIVVAYRFDAYPDGPGDPKAVLKEFQAVELQQEGLLRLEPAQQRTYYVAVFLKFEAAGREFFSRGEQAKLDLASKVVLTYSLSKRRFSSKLTVELVADRPAARIPEIAMVWLVGHTPVFEESAQHLMTIPPQPVQFPFSFTVDLPSLPRNAYVKPFVHDPAFQLKLATSSTNKVS